VERGRSDSEKKKAKKWSKGRESEGTRGMQRGDARIAWKKSGVSWEGKRKAQKEKILSYS